GAQMVAPTSVGTAPPVPMLGHVTSSYRSPTLGRTFALAMVAGGRERIGTTLVAPLQGGDIEAEVTAPVFYDERNERRDGGGA
ncbi:MAG TPA: glycine cleavage T C-terminal barrel domain-containing protein, partial [Actinomycetota bacterium]